MRLGNSNSIYPSRTTIIDVFLLREVSKSIKIIYFTANLLDAQKRRLTSDGTVSHIFLYYQ